MFKYAVFDIKQHVIAKFSSQMFDYTQQNNLDSGQWRDRPLTGGVASLPPPPLSELPLIA